MRWSGGTAPEPTLPLSRERDSEQAAFRATGECPSGRGGAVASDQVMAPERRRWRSGRDSRSAEQLASHSPPVTWATRALLHCDTRAPEEVHRLRNLRREEGQALGCRLELRRCGPLEAELAVCGVHADHVAVGEVALEQSKRKLVD